MSFFYVYQLPVPRLTKADRTFQEIVDRAAKLICTTPEFDDLAAEVGLGSHTNGTTDETDRAKLRAELDGIIAHLYNLTESEFAHILSTFPIVPQETKNAALQAYRDLAPLPGDPEILALIQSDETHHLEFKSSAWWDIPNNKKEKFNPRILKSVASFLNTQGGDLFIGVDDDRTILGIEYDYNKKLKPDKNRDTYRNNLLTALLSAFGQDSAPNFTITFHAIDNKDICRLTITPSSKPIYLKDGQTEHLYIRGDGSTRSLTISEAANYIKQRWG